MDLRLLLGSERFSSREEGCHHMVGCMLSGCGGRRRKERDRVKVWIEEQNRVSQSAYLHIVL